MCLCLQRFIAQGAKNGKTYFNKIYKIVQQNIREITQIARLFCTLCIVNQNQPIVQMYNKRCHKPYMVKWLIYSVICLHFLNPLAALQLLVILLTTYINPALSAK